MESGFWFFWKVPLAGWGWTQGCKALKVHGLNPGSAL